MIGEIAALAAALAFGLSTVLARRFMVVIPPESGVLVSIAINVVVFVSLALGAAWRGLLPPVRPASIAYFIAGGLAGTLVGRNLSYMSVDRLGAALSTTIRLSNSVFTLLFGLVVLHELPRRWQLAGMAVLTAGLWVSLWSRERPVAATLRSVNVAGLLLALGSAAAFSLGDTVRRVGLLLTPAPLLGAAAGASAALVAHLIWSVYHRSARWPAWSAFRRPDLLGSAVCNTLAILLLFIGLQHAPVAIVAVLYNLQALVVLIAGPRMLPGQETITAGLAVGTLLALVGTAMILLG
ncbi:MAG: EamA family transporter [Armatimonadetes bacterium]|nr:EamA family transporter [Armatimonadota bacterium]